MRISSFVIAVVLLSLSSTSLDHPLKVSFSKLEIKEDGYVELETHIFWDDLTLHLEEQYDLYQPDFSTITTEATQTLQLYLADHFYFEQDGERIKLWVKNISFSENGLALKVDMSTTDLLDRSKNMFLVNTILCDANPRQKNYVKFSGDNFVFSVSKPKIEIYTYAPVSNY